MSERDPRITENPAEEIKGVLERIIKREIPVDEMPDSFQYVRDNIKKVPAAQRDELMQLHDQTIERVTKRFKAYCKAGWDAILDDDE